MSDLVDLFTRAKADGDPAAMVDAIPYARWLGITPETIDGRLGCKLTFSPMLIGNPSLPALHGGTVAALLESTAAFHVLWELETVVLPKTISMTVEYTRPGRPMDTFARATITRQGRRVVNVRAEAWQESPDRVIASATAHFLVLPR